MLKRGMDTRMGRATALPILFWRNTDEGRQGGVPKRTTGNGVPARQGKQARGKSAERDTFIRIARSQILTSWEQIVKGLIDQAVQGGYQHAKMLLELCGISKIEQGKKRPAAKSSLSDQLLKGLAICVEERDTSKDRNHDKGNTNQDGHAKHTNGR